MVKSATESDPKVNLSGARCAVDDYFPVRKGLGRAHGYRLTSAAQTQTDPVWGGHVGSESACLLMPTRKTVESGWEGAAEPKWPHYVHINCVQLCAHCGHTLMDINARKSYPYRVISIKDDWCG